MEERQKPDGVRPLYVTETLGFPNVRRKNPYDDLSLDPRLPAGEERVVPQFNELRSRGLVQRLKEKRTNWFAME